MPKRLKKAPPKDVNKAAHALVARLDADDDAPPAVPPAGLSAYMSALGRKGGTISGAKRKTNLSDEKRRTIASIAARARWAKRPATKKR